MLSSIEYEKIGIINRSTQIALSSVVGVASVPVAAIKILEAEKSNDALVSFGSKILDRYGKNIGLGLPPILWDENFNKEKPQAVVQSCTLIVSGFLGSVYEILKSNHYSDNPIWQFFRHVRNACFHGNQFYFMKGQPNKPASWRGMEIDSSLNGSTLIFDFIGIGDCFLLVADIMNEAGVPTGKPPVYNMLLPDWTI